MPTYMYNYILENYLNLLYPRYHFHGGQMQYGINS